MIDWHRRAWARWVIAMSALGTGGAAQAQVDPALREAFLAFFPMYEMARLRHLAVDEPANPVRRAVNQFQHGRRLLDHTARNVTAPNNDTLYSSARLDVSRGPVSIESPHFGKRYYSLHLMNQYTDNLAILGTREGGEGPLRVAVVGPGWQGAVPDHTHLVRSDTNELWLLIRVLVDGPQDIAAVASLQEAMRLHAPAGPFETPRVRPRKDPDPALFLAVINESLARNPPQGAMASRAQAAQAWGIRAGVLDAWESLDAGVRAAWTAAWPHLMAELVNPARRQTRRIGGWDFPPPGVGRWGDNLYLRASVALRGIAALDPEETLYLNTFNDIDGQPLDGTARYRIRIPADGVPVRGFWSLTMYEVLPDGRMFLVDNPIRRYSVGDRTRGLARQPDGSIELLVQADPPADPTNWLPAPRGRFRFSLRAYLPDPELVAGRRELPRVERLAP